MRIAVVGATGAVGQELLELLHERRFGFDALSLYASNRSAGKGVEMGGQSYPVQALPEDGDLRSDLVFSSAGGGISRTYAWRWVEHGAVVIDNTSAWRMDERVPLVVPEVNKEASLAHQGVIANPNCSTIIALMALAPLHRAFGLKRAVVATYQAVSGAGAKGIAELEGQSHSLLHGSPSPPAAFAHPIAFNLFSHDSEVGADGYNVEERKLLYESRKILAEPELALSCTAVRVPVFRAHSEAIHAQFSVWVRAEEVREVLQGAPGLRLVDDRAGNHFPMPIEAANQNEVLVGRVREDSALPGGIALFVAGDQIRKGAALNALQIAEFLTRRAPPG